MRNRFLLLAHFLSVTSGQLRWQLQKVTNGDAPEPRRDAAIGYDRSGNQVVLFGGRAATTFGDTWIYNITSGTWRLVGATMSPPPRFSMVYGTSEGHLYVATGEQSGTRRSFFNDIWRFNFRTENWEELPAQGSSLNGENNLKKTLEPESRYGAAGGIFPGSSKFYVNQGFAALGYFDTFSYDVKREGWNRMHCPPGQCNAYDPRYPHARCLHAGTMVGADSLMIFGGCLTGGGLGGPCPSGDSWLFNGRTLVWTRTNGCPSPRIYGSMAMLPVVSEKKKVALYGGIEDGPQVIRTSLSGDEAVFIFDVVSQTWSVAEAYPENGKYPSKRASASMVTADSGIYVFGGITTDSGNVSSELWLLIGDSDTVELSSFQECPQHFISMATLHAIFMVVGWGFFLQWGMFLARYFRFRTSETRMWYYVHIIFQGFGLFCSITGLVFAILSVQSNHLQFVHGFMGLITVVLGVLQPINAMMRPRKQGLGQETSRRRKLWKWLHHTTGQVSVLMAFINISLGLFMIVAIEILWAVWFGYFGFVIFVYIIAEMISFCRTDPVKQIVFPNTTPSLVANKKFLNAYTNAGIEQDTERL